MHLFHEVDATILLATALASKRRPADLEGVMAAAELIQGFVPTEAKLADALLRLSSHGLIREADGGYLLTADAKLLASGQPRKTDTAQRVLRIRENLAGYRPSGEHAAIRITAAQFSAALQAHRATLRTPAKNMLLPKSKTEWDYSRPGPKHKPLAARRRKP